jgi:hypothetical protein
LNREVREASKWKPNLFISNGGVIPLNLLLWT